MNYIKDQIWGENYKVEGKVTFMKAIVQATPFFAKVLLKTIVQATPFFRYEFFQIARESVSGY